MQFGIGNSRGQKYRLNDFTCTEFVQRGLSLALTRSFDSRARFFHTVFNRIVENSHEAFMRFEPQ